MIFKFVAQDNVYDIMSTIIEFLVRTAMQFQHFTGAGVILLIIAVCRLIFGTDKLYKYSFAFKNVWLQRFCRILLVVVFAWGIWIIWHTPQIFVNFHSSLVSGCLSFLVFVCGVWLILLVLDIIWLILACILFIFRSFISWLW